MAMRIGSENSTKANPTLATSPNIEPRYGTNDTSPAINPTVKPNGRPVNARDVPYPSPNNRQTIDWPRTNPASVSSTSAACARTVSRCCTGSRLSICATIRSQSRNR